MIRLSLDQYRKNWPRVGAVLGMGLLGGATLASSKTMTPRALAAINFASLLAHQYEEYVDPGFFPGQFNAGLFGSDSCENYPLNTNTACLINTALAYPFYLAPVLAPKNKVLGLAPVGFGLSQVLGHGLIFPKKAHARYSPGFLASALLHLPVGIAWIKAVNKTDHPLTKKDIARGVAYQVIFSALAVGAPNALLKDRESPHAFTRRQMGKYDLANKTEEGKSR